MRTKFFCTAVAFANILLGAGCERDNGEILRPPSPASKTLTVHQLWFETIRSTNRGVTWETVSNYDPSMRLVGPDGGKSSFATSPEGLWRKTPEQQSWTCVQRGGITSRITCLLFDRTTSNMLVGTEASGLFISSNRGISWQWINGPFSQMYVAAVGVTISRAILVAAYKLNDNFPGKLFRSADRGQSWAMVNSSTWTAGRIVAGGHGTVFLAGDDAVYCSKDDGLTWTKSSMNDAGFSDFATDNAGTVFASTASSCNTGRIVRSTDDGAHWSRVLSADIPIHALVRTPRGSIVATSDYVCFCSTDNGSTWGSFLR